MNSMSNFDIFKIDEYIILGESFKGKDIYKWIQKNLHSEDYDNQFIAKDLYERYYYNSHKIPNERSYYYITNSNMRYILSRDKVLSPEKAEYISYKKLDYLIRDINSIKKSIINNNKCIDEDIYKIKKIEQLLNNRMSRVIGDNNFNIRDFDEYNIYKTYQIYIAYKEALLDLEMLKENIF